MTSTNNALRRRAVVLLAGTAIAVLSSAAPAFADARSDSTIPVTSSGTTENLGKKKPPPPPRPVLSDIMVTKLFDSASP